MAVLVIRSIKSFDFNYQYIIIVVKELMRKECQKKGSRYERINTICMLTYLFRPLAHMSKRRARFDVGCLKAWWYVCSEMYPG